MIEVQQIADFLNTELNNIGKSQGYNFDIKAEVGKRTNENAIYGIVSTTKADARVDENVDYVFAVELSVPSAQSNENVINVEKIIGEFKNKFHMKNRAFGGGQGTLLISLATPKDYQIKYVVGDDVPLVFSISTTFIRNAVGSGDKHWLLNGMEIPFINESVSVQKEGRTNTIHGESYTKTLLTRQTRYYKFKFDYDNSELCIMLKKDLLNGKYDKVYTLTYYDGVSFTQEQPFTTSVSIFMNGVSSSNKPNVSEFDITFTDVTNEVESEYYLALIDNPFDSTSENTRYFESQEKQKEYYQDKIDKDIRLGGVGCQFVKIKALNLGSVVITNQVYEIPLYEDKPIYDVFSVANKNYAIIKVVKDKEEEWFYYYVSNQNIGGQNQVMFDLKLDSLQTIYFDPKLEFGDCLIEKAHLNRFISDEKNNNIVHFDGTVDSKLFEREDIQNVAKRLTKRTKLNLYPDTELGNWFNNNVLGWVYMFIDPIHEYAYIKADDLSKGHSRFSPLMNRTNNGLMPTNMAVMVYPVLKENNEIVLYGTNSTTGSFRWGAEYSSLKPLMEEFADLNDGYSYVWTTKFSIYPPFKQLPDFTYSINSGFGYNYLSINVGEITDKISLKFGGYGLNYDALTYAFRSGTIEERGNIFPCMSHMIIAEKEFIPQNYLCDKQFKFEKSEIIESNKNVKFNPKLLASDYFSLKVSDSTENGFEYDLQKLNNNNLPFIFTESITPEFTKRYIRIKESGLYIKETSENLTGFVASNDNSFAMPTDDFQAMLANNKNFFVQNDINRKTEVLKSGISTGISALSSASTGNFMGVVGSIGQFANTGISYNQSVINEKLSVDNMKNAPSNIVQAKGNVVFECQYSTNGIIVEEHDILDNEKEMINDYMCLYGFTVNRFGNPKDYDNIRHYYNYVKAQIDSIRGIPISNAVRDDIRQRFAKGVRFWNSDNIDYDMENYEEWLNRYRVKISNSQSLSVIMAYYDNDKEYTQYASKENDFFVNEYINKIEIRYYNEDYVGKLNYAINTDGKYTITSGNRDGYWYDEITFNNATYVYIDLIKQIGTITINNPNNYKYSIVYRGNEYKQSSSGIDTFGLASNNTFIDIKYDLNEVYYYNITTDGTYREEMLPDNDYTVDRITFNNITNANIEVRK